MFCMTEGYGNQDEYYGSLDSNRVEELMQLPEAPANLFDELSDDFDDYPNNDIISNSFEPIPIGDFENGNFIEPISNTNINVLLDDDFNHLENNSNITFRRGDRGGRGGRSGRSVFV